MRFLISTAFVMTMASPALAQDRSAGEDAVVLEDVVVTADRMGSFGADLVQVGTFRNARVVDVPLTINVVPNELLRAQAASGLFDALRNTAGVSRAQLNGSAYDNVAIRGILVENRTSYRLNGVLPTVNLIDLPIENKDRVEVLKGVGALYYGYAPPSGIVNMVTKRPTRDLTEVTASVSEHGAAYAAADVSRRITDRFGLRVNGAAGLLETGVARVDGQGFMAAAAADWQISDAITARVDVEHVNKDITETAAIQLPSASGGRIVLPPIADPRANLGGKNLRYAASATDVLGRVDVRLSRQVALTVEAGQAVTMRDRDFSQLESVDFRPGANYGNGTLRVFRTRDQRYRNRILRVEVAGAFATGPIIHNIIAGINSTWRFQSGRNGTALTVAQNYFEPRDVQVAAPTVFTTAPITVRDRGAYVTDRAVLGPVELMVGARYSDYRSRAVSTVGIASGFERDRWTPSIAAVVKPVRNISLYATYLEGLEEGGTAPIAAANSVQVLEPAVSRQYEVGVKAEALAGVTLQLAGFKIIRPFAFLDPSDNVFKLAGRSRYQGIEGSLTGEVTRHLSIYASGQYLDARVRNATPVALIGKRPENTPEWTGSLYAEYRVPALPGLAIGGGGYYVGDRAANALNQAFVDGYTTFSASLRYTAPVGGKPVTFQINADNLTDERYWSAAGNTLLGVGLPRQVKVTTRIAL
ncbi:TonB-dependent siderophore receptor [uncultured Sphingomonas sp.]|uniref:TonB-dependent siderophore receptor n=1 Tax=uncultured Sphingomonas sp. TaxID=158754 RepID=UPI00374A7B74